MSADELQQAIAGIDKYFESLPSTAETEESRSRFLAMMNRVRDFLIIPEGRLRLRKRTESPTDQGTAFKGYQFLSAMLILIEGQFNDSSRSEEEATLATAFITAIINLSNHEHPIREVTVKNVLMVINLSITGLLEGKKN